jgi:hypothetical protein
MLVFQHPARCAILGIAIYLWLFHRRAFASYAIVLMMWLLIFMVYWLMLFGQVLPDYYRLGSLLDVSRAASTLPAILVSPSRGLLAFVPWITIVIYLLVRYWQSVDHQIASLAVGVICGNLLIVASSPFWWAGWSYGPRLLTGTIPWFVLLGALGCRCLETDSRRNTIVRGIGLALIVVAIVINGWGAVSWSTVFWNGQVAIDEHPETAWDWHHPQFLAGLPGLLWKGAPAPDSNLKTN